MGKTLQREYYNAPMYEVEEMIKSSDHDLTTGYMATISGLKGRQFGHEIFASLIKFKDMMDFLQVFPNVQRNVIGRKVTKIKNYIVSYVENPEGSMRFFPAITVTARGNIFHDEITNKVAIDTQKSRLSVNDGQHRFYGISDAIAELTKRHSRAKDEQTREKYAYWVKELKEMVIPMTMFNNLTEAEEKQLFHDTNQLPQRPSRSANIRLVQTDRMARIARELSEENRYLKHYGVEMSKMSIHENNPNTILLTTVYAMIRLFNWQEYSVYGADFIKEENYENHKQRMENTFNELFYVLPHDMNEKGKYLLEKSYALRGIAKYIYNARLEGFKDSDIFATIKKMDWSQNLEAWEAYGAMILPSGKISFRGNGEGGINGIYSACMDVLRGGRVEQGSLEV
jgi:DNA sulfur modification protein DndB